MNFENLIFHIEKRNFVETTHLLYKNIKPVRNGLKGCQILKLDRTPRPDYDARKLNGLREITQYGCIVSVKLWRGSFIIIKARYGQKYSIGVIKKNLSIRKLATKLLARLHLPPIRDVLMESRKESNKRRVFLASGAAYLQVSSCNFANLDNEPTRHVSTKGNR